MWNRLKWFSGLLVVMGCLMIWLTFVPIDFFLTHSYLLRQVGFLFISVGIVYFVIISIVLGINSVVRFRPEPHFILFKSKRTTRSVATLIVVMLVITAFVWWIPKELFATQALPPTEITQHPSKYLGEEVVVDGYFYPPGIFFHYGPITEGIITTKKITEEVQDPEFLFNFLLGEGMLYVELPENARVFGY